MRELIGSPGQAVQPGRSGVVIASHVCARASSALLGAGLPVVMVVSNKSAPVLLGVGALLAVLAALLAGRRHALRERVRRLTREPILRLCGAVSILMAVSLLWSVDRPLTTRGLVEAMPELAAAAALAVAWPLTFRPDDKRFLVAGLGLAALLIGVEKITGMSLHGLAVSRAFHSDLKRSGIPLAVLLWPALAHCARDTKVRLSFGLAAAVLVAVVIAHSGASFFALIAGGLTYGFARVAPAPALGMVTMVLVVVMVGSGWAGTSAKRGLAEPLVSGLSSVHAAQRIRIWRAFERRIIEHPLVGHGFNTSQGISPDILPEDVTPEQESSLASVHPHSMFLQIWVELGAVGILVSLAIVLFVLNRIRGSDPDEVPIRLGLLVTIVGIGLVSMSPWQPWWIATLAVSLFWLRLAPATTLVQVRAGR